MHRALLTYSLHQMQFIISRKEQERREQIQRGSFTRTVSQLTLHPRISVVLACNYVLVDRYNTIQRALKHTLLYSLPHLRNLVNAKSSDVCLPCDFNFPRDFYYSVTNFPYYNETTIQNY